MAFILFKCEVCPGFQASVGRASDVKHSGPMSSAAATARRNLQFHGGVCEEPPSTDLTDGHGSRETSGVAGKGLRVN